MVRDTLVLQKIRREPLEAYMAICLEIQPFVARWSRYIHLMVFAVRYERYKPYGLVAYDARIVVDTPNEGELAIVKVWVEEHMHSDTVASVTGL